MSDLWHLQQSLEGNKWAWATIASGPEATIKSLGTDAAKSTNRYRILTPTEKILTWWPTGAVIMGGGKVELEFAWMEHTHRKVPRSVSKFHTRKKKL